MAQPTESGFLTFIRGVMDITAQQLPDDSPFIGWALHAALNVVNLQLNQLANANPPPGWSIYQWAVYNLAGDRLVNFAPNNTAATSAADKVYFTTLRKSLNLTTFIAGVISGSSDESTSQTMVVPDAMKGLTIANLQQLKTPWGQEYLGIAQAAGPLWGVT